MVVFAALACGAAAAPAQALKLRTSVPASSAVGAPCRVGATADDRGRGANLRREHHGGDARGRPVSRLRADAARLPRVLGARRGAVVRDALGRRPVRQHASGDLQRPRDRLAARARARHQRAHGRRCHAQAHARADRGPAEAEGRRPVGRGAGHADRRAAPRRSGGAGTGGDHGGLPRAGERALAGRGDGRRRLRRRDAPALVRRPRRRWRQLRAGPGEVRDLRPRGSGDRPPAGAGAGPAGARARRQRPVADAPRPGRPGPARRGAVEPQADPAGRHAGARPRRRQHAVGDPVASGRPRAAARRPGPGRRGARRGHALALARGHDDARGRARGERRRRGDPGRASASRRSSPPPTATPPAGSARTSSTSTGRARRTARSARGRTSAPATGSPATSSGSRCACCSSGCPNLRLDPEQTVEITGWEFRGPRRLPVVWDA